MAAAIEELEIIPVAAQPMLAQAFGEPAHHQRFLDGAHVYAGDDAYQLLELTKLMVCDARSIHVVLMRRLWLDG